MNHGLTTAAVITGHVDWKYCFEVLSLQYANVSVSLQWEGGTSRANSHLKHQFTL
jgi:hypothetical protein